MCALLDVVGYNYFHPRFEYDSERYPARIICGTESRAMAVVSAGNTPGQAVLTVPLLIDGVVG